MQFAGQRTDKDFNPIGEPQNWLIKLTEEVLPDPDAILITGITPQKTIEEGYSEAEFLKMFSEEVLQPDTIITGFNNIRFDDEFMRQTLWRNFYDAYEWQYQDGRTRWDLLDVVRMVRALRPDGINWPFEERSLDNSSHGQPSDGETISVPSNRLELLTKANKLDHSSAHDALSDVWATIAVAKLIKNKQSSMFDYLLGMRGKKQILELINPQQSQPFVYTSGRYSYKWEKTTVVAPIAETAHGGVLVYDLRQDPATLSKLTDEQIIEVVFSRNPQNEILAVKELKISKCPAVAPLGVFNAECQDRLDLKLSTIEANINKLRQTPGLSERLAQLYQRRSEMRQREFETLNKRDKAPDPDFQLYDGFVDDKDKTKQRAIRVMDENELADQVMEFSDERLTSLLPRYKARNFPRSLNAKEEAAWRQYQQERITDGAVGQLSLADFMNRLGELAELKTDDKSQFLLEELQLYAANLTQ